MRQKLFLKLNLFIISILLLSTIVFAEEPSDIEYPQKLLSEEDIFSELELFADAVTLINANYAEEKKPKDMIYGALDGMLSSLDSYSSFLTPEEFKEMRTDTKGEFGGIGITVTVREKVLTVVSPVEGTPGCRAGILPGDKIIRIDGESTRDFTLDDAVEKLRGAPGSEVKLTIIREQEDKLKEFTVKRAIIKIESIKEAYIAKDNIGYIRIVEFQQNTPKDLDKSVKSLLKKQIGGLILDLRSNPGGLLDTAVLSSEKFLKRGTPIVSIRGRIKQQNADFKSSAFKPYLDFPMVVLINEGSASASEIAAGALKDNKRALVLGKTSFGKGAIQTVIPMADGSAIRLTTSHYYTPAGNIVHEKGITPNAEVEWVKPKLMEGISIEEIKKLSLLERLKEDNQVQAAIELLKDKERYEAIINS